MEPAVAVNNTTGLISCTSGTITFKKFEASLKQVFDASCTAGKIQFAIGSTKEVYPQWWGATGEGVIDDSVAVQSAVSAYRRVFFPLPTSSYYCASNITVTTDGQELVGSKSKISFGGTHGFDVSGTTGSNVAITVSTSIDTFSLTVADTTGYAAGDVIVLHDVANNEFEINRVAYIDSGTVLYTQYPLTYAFTQANGSLLKKANTVKDVEISNLDITNPSVGMGIYTVYAENIDIHSNVFHDMASSGVSDTISLGTRIIGNTFYNCGTGGTGPAIGALMSRNGTIQNNSHASQQNDEDISLFKRCWGFDISNNSIGQQADVGVGGKGIYIVSACSYNRIVRNTIYRTNGNGITLTSFGGVAANRRNVIAENVIQNAADSGIKLIGAASSDNTGNIIRDNILIGNVNYGLEIDSNSKNSNH
jgi:hypothetical protein